MWWPASTIPRCAPAWLSSPGRSTSLRHARRATEPNRMWQKSLVPVSRVTTLARAADRLHGERGALIAAVAQERGRIAETRLKILQIDENLRSEVGKELGEIRAKPSELGERRVAAED